MVLSFYVHVIFVSNKPLYSTFYLHR